MKRLYLDTPNTTVLHLHAARIDMKKLFIALFLILFLTSPSWAATYYVRSGGNNGTCDGTQNEDAGDGTCAWATLSYACGQVSGANEIYVANSITDNSQCVLAAGVDINGAGKGSVNVTTNVTDVDGYIKLLTEWPALVSGNHTISNITFRGGTSGTSRNGYLGIRARRRHNITIHDADFKWFRISGIWIDNYSGETVAEQTEWPGYPTAYPDTVPPSWVNTISIYNCDFYRTSGSELDTAGGGADPSPWGFTTGAITIGGGVEDVTIDNVNIYNDFSNCGQCIDMQMNYGWLDNVEIENSHFECDHTYASVAFAIEGYRWRNDSKIHDNTFESSISMVRRGQAALEGASSWHVQIYNNTFDLTGYTDGAGEGGMSAIEIAHNFVEVYNNYVECDGSWCDGFFVGPDGGDVEGVMIRNNAVYFPNYTGVFISDNTTSGGLDDIFIYNNVLDGGLQGQFIVVYGLKRQRTMTHLTMSE